MKKGISLVMGVLFIAIVISATAVVYEVGYPVVQKMQCAAITSRMQSTFAKLDKVIQEAAAGGEGSKRVINLRIDEGTMTIDTDNDIIYWDYECEAPIISPRSSQRYGNIVIGVGLDAVAYEGSCLGETAYVLENAHVKACFRKIGTPSSPVSYNTSQILLGVYQKDVGKWMPIQSLSIMIDGNVSSQTGTGYTKITQEGNNLPYGEVVAYIDSDYNNIDYYIHFILESGADFLTIKGS